jgi:hypothetical protein
MQHRSSIACPHCRAAMPRISVWQSIPGKGHPNYTCGECHKPAWFPLGTRVLAMLAMAGVLLATTWFALSLRGRETDSPAAMVITMILLICAGGLASAWVAGAICAQSSFLVRGNFGSAR